MSRRDARLGKHFTEFDLSAPPFSQVESPAMFAAGKVISTSVPSFGALERWNLARFASAIALVSGRPSPVPPRGEVESCRNGSSAVAISFSVMPTPVSRTRRTTSPLSFNAVETMTCPPAEVISASWKAG